MPVFYENVKYDTPAYEGDGTNIEKLKNARVFKTKIIKWGEELECTAFEIMPGIVIVPYRFHSKMPAPGSASKTHSYYRKDYLVSDTSEHPLETQRKEYFKGTKKVLKYLYNMRDEGGGLIDKLLDKLSNTYITNDREDEPLTSLFDSTNCLPVINAKTGLVVGNKSINVIIMNASTDKAVDSAQCESISPKSGRLGMGTLNIVTFNPHFTYVASDEGGEFVCNPALRILHEMIHAVRAMNGLRILKKTGNNWGRPEWTHFIYMKANIEDSVAFEELFTFGGSAIFPNELEYLNRYTTRLMHGGSESGTYTDDGYYKNVEKLLKRYSNKSIPITVRDALVQRFNCSWSGEFKNDLCVGTFKIDTRQAYNQIDQFRIFTETSFAEILQTKTRKHYCSIYRPNVKVVSFPVMDDKYFSEVNGMNYQFNINKWRDVTDGEILGVTITSRSISGVRKMTQRLSHLLPWFNEIPNLDYPEPINIDEDTIREPSLIQQVDFNELVSNHLIMIKETEKLVTATHENIEHTQNKNAFLIEDEDLISQPTTVNIVEKNDAAYLASLMKPITSDFEPEYTSDVNTLMFDKKKIYVPDLRVLKTLESGAGKVMLAAGMVSYAKTLLHDFTMDTEEYRLSGTSIGWDALSIIPFVSSLRALTLVSYLESIKRVGIDALFFIEGGVLPAIGLVLFDYIAIKHKAEVNYLKAADNYMISSNIQINENKSAAIDNWINNVVFRFESQVSIMSIALQNHISAIVEELKYKYNHGNFNDNEKRMLEEEIEYITFKLQQRAELTLLVYQKTTINASISWFKRKFMPNLILKLDKIIRGQKLKVENFLSKGYEDKIISEENFIAYLKKAKEFYSNISKEFFLGEVENIRNKIDVESNYSTSKITVFQRVFGQVMQIKIKEELNDLVDLCNHYNILLAKDKVSNKKGRSGRVISIEGGNKSGEAINLTPLYKEKFSENSSIETEFAISFWLRIPLLRTAVNYRIYSYVEDSNRVQFELWIKGSSLVFVLESNNLDNKETILNEFIISNCWNQFLIGRDAEKYCIYQNGKLIFNVINKRSLPASFNGRQIFYSIPGNNYQIDDICYYTSLPNANTVYEIWELNRGKTCVDFFGDALEYSTDYYLSGPALANLGLVMPQYSPLIVNLFSFTESKPFEIFKDKSESIKTSKKYNGTPVKICRASYDYNSDGFVMTGSNLMIMKSKESPSEKDSFLAYDPACPIKIIVTNNIDDSAIIKLESASPNPGRYKLRLTDKFQKREKIIGEYLMNGVFAVRTNIPGTFHYSTLITYSGEANDSLPLTWYFIPKHPGWNED